MLSALCNEIYQLFLAGSKGTNRKLLDRAYDLSSYFMRNRAAPELLDTVIGLENKLIASNGPYRQFLEERVFEALYVSALHCAPEHSDTVRMTLDPEIIERSTDDRETQRYMMALKLVNFSMEVFQLKIGRDSFNNKRKGLAMNLIGRVAAYL